jgi:MinD superfamily P-loop ATPase
MFKVTDECIACGSCAPFCKNGAIEWGELHYSIDPEKCDMCGTCREYCPIDDAIVDTELIAQKQIRE